MAKKTGKTPKAKPTKIQHGKGLYIGSSNLVCKSTNDLGEVIINKERNSFLRIRDDANTLELINSMHMKYYQCDNKTFLVGESAFKLANIFERSAQKSMQIGVFNPLEKDSIAILKIILMEVVGKPSVKDEICCFSVPSSPFDACIDLVYYQGIIERILRELGYTPMPLSEGFAVILSELENSSYTGLAISCSGGMSNICAAFRTINMLSFSITMGGDWIDENAARTLNMPINKITEIKESGMSLLKPKTRDEEAIVIYYKHYINYLMEKITQVFSVNNKAPQFEEPINIIFAGSPVLIDGFLEVVKQNMEILKFDFDVNSITLAENPSTSVANGCYLNAVNLSS
ncbi:MAG: hypothetical protein HQL29_05050 [Candidatus Omnitrophica bacterium]|nr:hypothetical protein [Candidatus Omnitrophota bacterium]